MRWRDEDGPERATTDDLWDYEFHLQITCNPCQRTIRITPQEASELVGGKTPLALARDLLVCSWCGAKGRNYIDVRPDSLDVSAKMQVANAHRYIQSWPRSEEGPRQLDVAEAEWEKRRPKDRLESMCNAYRLRTSITKLMRDMDGLGLPLHFEGGSIPNVPEFEMTRPTNELPVLRPTDAFDPSRGVQLLNKRWWLVPFFHRGPVKDWKAMCTNARAETVATSRTFKGPFERRRCLVPADAYYEWTGEKGSKTRWRFERPDGDWWSFAGLWDRAETSDGMVESFTIITTEAGPDSAPYHTRQPVLLEKSDFTRWLDLSADASQMLRPSPVGSLIAVQA